MSVFAFIMFFTVTCSYAAIIHDFVSLFILIFYIIIFSLPAAISSPSSMVNAYLSNPRIATFTVSSTFARPLPPSFLDKYILATSLLGFNARCSVISFLVLPLICFHSTPVQCRKTAEHLSNEITHNKRPKICRFIVHLLCFHNPTPEV